MKIKNPETGNAYWLGGRPAVEKPRPDPIKPIVHPVDPGPLPGDPDPVDPIIDPDPTPVTPIPEADEAYLTGMRNEILKALHAIPSRAVTVGGTLVDTGAILHLFETHMLSVLLAMAKVETDFNSKAINKNDGAVKKELGRRPASIGLFQFQETTSAWMYQNRYLIAPRLPSNPSIRVGVTPEQNAVTMTKIPESINTAIIAAMLFCIWANQDFGWSWDEQRWGLKLVAKKSSDRDVAEWCNQIAAADDRLTPIGILLRLYWAMTSKGGPAYALRTGVADTVVLAPKRAAPFRYVNAAINERVLVWSSKLTVTPQSDRLARVDSDPSLKHAGNIVKVEPTTWA